MRHKCPKYSLRIIVWKLEFVILGILFSVSVLKSVELCKIRHWDILERINGVLYNLESDLVAPETSKDTVES